jgi:predicted nuclease of predicted toxin-antitoxin system
MKLLLDQNLSYRLVGRLSKLFPGTQHVGTVGLADASDADIWEHAKLHDFVIASKDSDFYHRSMLLGHPPNVIWVRVGNCTTENIATLLEHRYLTIVDFEQDQTASFLVLA